MHLRSKVPSIGNGLVWDQICFANFFADSLKPIGQQLLVNSLVRPFMRWQYQSKNLA